MKRILIIPALLIAIVSCSKVVEPQNEDVAPGGDNDFKAGQEVTLTIGTGIDSGSETRTVALWDDDEDSAETIDTRATGTLDTKTGQVVFDWEDGDKIKVTVDDKSSEFTMVSNTGNTATFRGLMPASGSKFSVDYPASGTPDLSKQTYNAKGLPTEIFQLSASDCTLGGTIHLKAAQSVLRLNFYGSSVTVGKIVVTNLSSKKSDTYTLECGGVTLGTSKTDATSFLLVVPIGSYQFSAEVFDNAKDPTSLVKVTTSSAKTFTAAKMLNMAQKEVVVGSVLPEGALPGIFSVSDTTRVRFSKGNLQATCTAASDPEPAAYSWGFAEHQYVYIGDAPGNKSIDSQTEKSVVDLFGWSTNAANNYYGINTSENESDYSGKFVDWGGIKTLPGNSGGKKWSTLSSAEWSYLFTTREDARSKYGFATVAGFTGIIILPDSFTDPNKNDGSGAFVPSKSKDYSTNVYTTGGNWEAMEAAGAVFLPAAGDRTGSVLNHVGSGGYYWSSSPSETNWAYFLRFNNSAIDLAGNNGCYVGYSVRLVTAVQ